MKYNRYEIQEELGRGAMGIVYLARDPQIDRLVALKVLRKDRVSSEQYVQRFLKEAVAVGRLSHPGIVMVYDIGRDHGTIYIAMEYLQGTPFNELMAARKFTLPEVVDIGIQAAAALDYAHQRGIIHRDIKPSNIIYSPEKQIKLTDFGIAHVEDPNGHHQTMPGEMLGTPLYMSPEQIAGQGVDGRSDIFSLSVILYELTTGKRPFFGENITAIFRAIADGKPQPPHELHPSIPPLLSDLIMKGLAKFPDSRHRSGAQFVADLEKVAPLVADRADAGSATVRLSPHEYIEQPVAPAARKDDTETLASTSPLDSLGNGQATELLSTGAGNTQQSVIGTGVTPKIGWTIVALVFVVVVVALGGLYFGKGRKNDGVVSVPAPLSLPAPSVPDPLEEAVTPHVTEPTIVAPAKPTIQPDPVEEASLLALLKLNSSPMGADIYIDGTFKGYTPLELNLNAAKHEVRLQLSDHLDWQAQLDLRKGGVTPLTITLLPEQ